MRNDTRQTAGSYAEIIRQFFERGVTVGLHLPDRWYGGRPMENQYDLTLALDRPSRLLIELDERILLIFTGDEMLVERVTTDILDPAGTPAVEVSGFDQLVVDARLYGSSEAKAATYQKGRVQFVSPR